MAHVRRCDYLVNLVQRAVEGILFYHPAAWWISRVIRMERENCCDDVAAAATGDAREYAGALAALAETRGSGREPALAAKGGSLVKRIRRLLYPEQPVGLHAPLFGALILIAAAAAPLAAWQAEPQQVSPYAKWLNEDVVYIILDEERAAFQELTAEDEREKFIEQFWLRRDPTPGAPVNEAKEEHYRRIRYANSRFASRNRAGWSTDRGRIYIQFGPPDEIEAHPSGYDVVPPFEVWRWHFKGTGKDVFITFLDRSRSGDYQVAPGPAR
jgi:GWxTD domain-containing protein